ncbi:hypothetical protein J3R30DRAFT_1571429 [Lentinula aciculospora]|uniref:Uncharacterized protein n=1 Tax=Lentinula aciculospora TaxID=153920 RepID=A0A9W8ZXM1_9AGAR|nr:hypothetical protein J3R30DRAFT_1571429 [Lentinula aciculospora]
MVGFFKRILSLGSRKSSRRKQAQAVRSNDWVDEVGAQTNQPSTSDEDHEIAVNLLLRSSSARYAVVSETDYTTLPPLPHPINTAISAHTESTASLPSASITRCGTYTVKVHPRQRHSSTEFPMANRGMVDEPPKTPQPRRRAQTTGDDSTHLQGLRRDPSVASLLDLYDEHGHLPLEAFSNTPPREGRPQTQRAGSTLRELLGEPANSHQRHNTSNSLEGDISWAERFLGEANSAASSVSSLILQTPDNIGSRFSDSNSISNTPYDSTFASEHDFCSASSFLDNPAISSMEVELSATAESSQVIESPYVTENPYQNLNQDPKTPRRASEVFGFLTEKRKSRPPAETLDRRLPGRPIPLSMPSEEDSTENPAFSRFSAVPSELRNNPAIDFCDTLSNESSDQHALYNNPRVSNGSLQQRPISRMLSHEETSLSYPREQASGPELEDVREVKVILTAPTRVIVTAPTPLADTSDRPTTRMPRGSRSLHRHRSRSSTKEREYRQGLVERSNSPNSSDLFTPIPSRPMKLRRSSASLSSTFTGSGSAHASISNPKSLEKENKSRSRRQGSTKSLMSTVFDKENTYTHTLGLAVIPDIPSTPVRSNSSSRSSPLLRTAVTPASFKPPRGMTPSPASSSELSPVGKMMMMDVRRQKSKMIRETQEKTARSHKSGGEGRRRHRMNEHIG